MRAVRETTAGMLQRHGPRVDRAGRPYDAQMNRSRSGRVDLIVTDYAMPLMSGGDMLKGARKIRPDLPGIIISGYADSRSIVQPGEVSVLTKPFTLEQMEAAIATAVPAGAEPGRVTPYRASAENPLICDDRC